MKTLALRPAVQPGSILGSRPLPLRPSAGTGLLDALRNWLGSGGTDLRTELLEVIPLLKANEPDHARLRLDRIIANLMEIRRDGTQFVLSSPEWKSILAAGTSTLQVAEQTRTQPEIMTTIQVVIARLEEFGAGKLDRSA